MKIQISMGERRMEMLMLNIKATCIEFPEYNKVERRRERVGVYSLSFDLLSDRDISSNLSELGRLMVGGWWWCGWLSIFSVTE
jgi:hypothetical protein